MHEPVIKFSSVGDKIIEIMENHPTSFLGINESVTLLEGFINALYTKTISNEFKLGGPFIPMIMFVGNETGRVYLFSYKPFMKLLGQEDG